jgi:hypothetical protein
MRRSYRLYCIRLALSSYLIRFLVTSTQGLITVRIVPVRMQDLPSPPITITNRKPLPRNSDITV